MAGASYGASAAGLDAACGSSARSLDQAPRPGPRTDGHRLGSVDVAPRRPGGPGRRGRGRLGIRSLKSAGTRAGSSAGAASSTRSWWTQGGRRASPSNSSGPGASVSGGSSDGLCSRRAPGSGSEAPAPASSLDRRRRARTLDLDGLLGLGLSRARRAAKSAARCRRAAAGCWAREPRRARRRRRTLAGGLACSTLVRVDRGDVDDSCCVGSTGGRRTRLGLDRRPVERPPPARPRPARPRRLGSCSALSAVPRPARPRPAAPSTPRPRAPGLRLGSACSATSARRLLGASVLGHQARSPSTARPSSSACGVDGRRGASTATSTTAARPRPPARPWAVSSTWT